MVTELQKMNNKNKNKIDDVNLNFYPSSFRLRQYSLTTYGSFFALLFSILCVAGLAFRVFNRLKCGSSPQQAVSMIVWKVQDKSRLTRTKLSRLNLQHTLSKSCLRWLAISSIIYIKMLSGELGFSHHIIIYASSIFIEWYWSELSPCLTRIRDNIYRLL